MSYEIRKAIHCRLICSLLNSPEDSSEYIHRVLSIMNTLGLLYPNYIYTNREDSWIDKGIAKGIMTVGTNIIDLFGGPGASEFASKYKKYTSEEVAAMVKVFEDQPYSTDLVQKRKDVYFYLLRFGCDKSCEDRGERDYKRPPEPGDPNYCSEAVNNPKCSN